MASRKKRPTDRPEKTDPQDPEFEGVPQRELIVMVKPDAGVRVSREGVTSAADPAIVKPLDAFVRGEGVILEPLFGESEERLESERSLLAAAMPGVEPPNLSVFYTVKAPDDQLEELADKLTHEALVEAAYVKPAAELPSTTDTDVRGRGAVLHARGAAEHEEETEINDMTPSPGEAPFATPDFTARQGYLGPAPAGVDARHAWTIPGGRGDGVQIIDCEWGWRFNHEDLRQNQGGVIAGANSSDDNHGTAVIGEIGGDDNAFGIVGICPNARVMAVSFTTMPTAAAIRLAANRLRAGDIILLEVHRAGPQFNFQPRADQRGYIAIEWWPDDYAAIRFAVSRGIIVVEAAGNGAEDFDDPLYDRRPAGFPASWRNPFNPANPSSGAVVVGAGAPPPGTHGRNHGPDRSRLGFSNFGLRVDCQGWGREVTTTGYGDLQGGSNRDTWYTDRFSGTSSASPIVVGALGAMQGILRSRARPLLDSPQAIQLLRATGSPQQDAPGRPRTQRIGNRPDLAQMIRRMIPVATAPLYRYWNPRIGDHFYTTDLRELGHGRYGWRYEQVQCQVYPSRMAGTVPLYRYWNPRIGDHFYTTDWRELGHGRHGWRFEQVQCYVVPSAVHGRPEAGGETFAPAEAEAEWTPDVRTARFESVIGGDGHEMPETSFATDTGEWVDEPRGLDVPPEPFGFDIGAASFTIEGVAGTGQVESSFVTEEARPNGSAQPESFTTVERNGTTETNVPERVSITINACSRKS